MTVTSNLPPDVEAGLVAQARAEGLPLDRFLSRKLQTLVEASGAEIGADDLAEAGEWEHRLDEWLDSFAHGTRLADDAPKRESWYTDRW